MRKNLKIVTIILVVLCMVNITHDVYILKDLRSTKEKYEQIIDKYNSSEDLIHILNKNMYKMQNLIFYQLVVSDDEKQLYSAQLEPLHNENVEIMNDIYKTLVSTEAKQIYNDLSATYLNFRNDQEIVKNILNNHAYETAKYFIDTVMEKRLEDMNKNLESLTELTKARVKDLKDEIDSTAKVSYGIAIGIMVITAQFMAVITIVAVKSSKKLVDNYDAEKQQHRDQVIKMQEATIQGMAELVESRDGDTGTHVKNTARYVEMIARELARDSKYKKDISEEYIELLTKYAPLHDAGKIVVSDMILLKPGKLTDEEFEVMKKHTVEGDKIIDQILSDIEPEESLRVAKDIARHHHEKWNGKGYPDRLSKTDIPLSARIMAVADVFDALISKRCYKDAFTIDNAYEIIEHDSGEHFDTEVVEAFKRLRPQIEEYLKEQEKN